MRILLLGHKGYLGSFLYEWLTYKNIYTEHNSTSHDYDYVINCIGKPNLEFCQQNPDISKESNLNIVERIINDFPNSKVIHFSSYYVYDDEGFCHEGSRTTDKYFYTKHKLESEKIVIENGGVCFRLGKLFGHMDLTKQGKLTEYIIQSDEITLDKVKFNPTCLKQVLEVVRLQLQNNCLSGLYNLSNKGHTTHLEYGKHMNQILGHSKKIKAVNKLRRQFHNYGRFLMDTGKLEQLIELRPWEQDLEEYLSKEGFRCLALAI